MGQKILIVDDSPGDRGLIIEAVERINCDYKIIEADNGEDAVAMVKEHNPTVVLLDTKLPGIDGFETCRRIKEIEGLNTKVVIFTGNIEVVDANKARKMGTDDYCVKTSDWDELVQTVKDILGIEVEETVGMSEEEVKKILVVDDDVSMQEILRERLSSNGHIVLTAGDADSCRDVLQKEVPDLIIMDVILPGITGLELCSRLKSEEKFSKIPIVILTGKPEGVDDQELEVIQADAYMSKPFDGKILLSKIEDLMAS